MNKKDIIYDDSSHIDPFSEDYLLWTAYGFCGTLLIEGYNPLTGCMCRIPIFDATKYVVDTINTLSKEDKEKFLKELSASPKYYHIFDIIRKRL